MTTFFTYSVHAINITIRIGNRNHDPTKLFSHTLQLGIPGFVGFNYMIYQVRDKLCRYPLVAMHRSFDYHST